nr:immunoglobulin mu heavy chain-like [Camelus dromedarius]
MELGLSWVVLAALLQGVQAEVQLVESGGGLVQPGGSLRLSCAASEYTYSTCSMNWYRQAPGKEREWVAKIRYDGDTEYSYFVKDRFTISQDRDKNEAYLQMANLKPEDTAMYFCNMRMCWGDKRDYWGQGTQVTVSSESSSAPTLFPLASCESPMSNESPVALGCLAWDFLPGSITFSWSYPNGIAVSSQSIKTFPSVLREGKYVATSQVLLPSQSVLQGSELICKVQHSKGNVDVRVPPPEVSRAPPGLGGRVGAKPRPYPDSLSSHLPAAPLVVRKCNRCSRSLSRPRKSSETRHRG